MFYSVKINKPLNKIGEANINLFYSDFDLNRNNINRMLFAKLVNLINACY